METTKWTQQTGTNDMGQTYQNQQIATNKLGEKTQGNNMLETANWNQQNGSDNKDKKIRSQTAKQPPPLEERKKRAKP